MEFHLYVENYFNLLSYLQLKSILGQSIVINIQKTSSKIWNYAFNTVSFVDDLMMVNYELCRIKVSDKEQY